MNPKNRLFRNIYDLVSDVKETLRENGFIIPIKHKDGSIQLNKFFITKKNNGFYIISDNTKRVRYDNINSPHTAILLANNLALGRSIDYTLLELDKQYGYYLFEQEQLKRVIKASIKNKDWSRVDACSIKELSAQQKVKNTKRLIVASFEKFRQQR